MVWILSAWEPTLPVAYDIVCSYEEFCYFFICYHIYNSLTVHMQIMYINLMQNKIPYTNCGKFFKRWEYQTTWPASWEICVQVKKQQLELDMEQQTGSKSGKEFVKAGNCHPAYLTYMQSTSWEMLGWMKHKLESRLQGGISITSDMQMTPHLWQKAKN